MIDANKRVWPRSWGTGELIFVAMSVFTNAQGCSATATSDQE